MADFDFEAFQQLVLEQFSDLREQIDAYRTEQIGMRAEQLEMRKEMREGFASITHRTDRLHSDLAALTGVTGSLVSLASGHAGDIFDLRRRVEDIERRRRDDG